MRLRKGKQPGMPPSQVEALGRLTPAELAVGAHTRVNAGGCADGQQNPCLLIAGESQTSTSAESLMWQAFGLELNAEIESQEKAILSRGEVKILPGCKPVPGQMVGLDWVSIVFNQSYFEEVTTLPIGFEEKLHRLANVASFEFMSILRIPIGDHAVYRQGLNMYRYAEGLPLHAGIVHVGHKSGTVLVSISGKGCLVAADGWQQRLYEFCRKSEAHLTRVDLCFDDYEGQIFNLQGLRRRHKRIFQRQGRAPYFEFRGDWSKPELGLTIYVGRRLSGKMARIYHKGIQLGIENSPWVRFEIEFRGTSFVLPLDVLTQPTKYFVAAYPACESIEHVGDRIDLEYKSKVGIQSVEKIMATIRHQFGAHLNALRTIYSADELLEKVCREGEVDWLNTFNRVGDLVLASESCPNSEISLSGA